jgi:hypothetical protein
VTITHLAFLAATGVFLSTLLFASGYFYLDSRRRLQGSWQVLFAKLDWVDRDAVAKIALSFADQSDRGENVPASGDLEPSQLWRLIGGLDGLEVMERNSEVLIDLAFYLHRFYPEALAIAERLRLDARELKWHVGRLKGAAETGNLQISFPFYGQRAVVSYYHMTRRLLSLYEAAHFSTLADLQRAL